MLAADLKGKLESGIHCLRMCQKSMLEGNLRSSEKNCLKYIAITADLALSWKVSKALIILVHARTMDTRLYFFEQG